MDNEAFLEELAEVLEVEKSELHEDYQLASEDWESLTIISIIAIVDQHFEVTLEADDLVNCSTVKNLLEAIKGA